MQLGVVKETNENVAIKCIRLTEFKFGDNKNAAANKQRKTLKKEMISYNKLVSTRTSPLFMTFT